MMGTITTEDKLHQAFIKLLATTPVNKMKVSQVVKVAGVSRGSFYNHYESIYDLLEDVEFQLLDGIPKTSQIQQVLRNKDIVREELIKKLAYIQENLTLIRLLTGKNGDPYFQYQLDKFFRPFVQEFEQTKSSQPLKMILTNVALDGARMSIIRWWANHPTGASIEQMANFLTTYIQSVAQSE